MSPHTGNFAAAIRATRLALGETQEGMACRLGCNLRAYQRWESGTSTPRAEWLMKILPLCPDDKARALFTSDTRLVPSSSFSPKSSSIKSSDAARQVRTRNTAIEAINTLFGLAKSGSTAAGRELADAVDRLQRRAQELSSAVRRPK